ncbi:MAG: hypothetical protein P9X24_02865 [Candidatus Hatepunaea meridiana]|nr:hypothetical protein [Candidatus Hatepunaea meridiana]
MQGKVYQIIPDQSASEESYVRVVDESGEDYLYPESYFVPVELPQKAAKALYSTSDLYNEVAESQLRKKKNKIKSSITVINWWDKR